ncbi:hypothetical protein EJB05_13544, partial [Eragrostis curvula]
MIDRIHVPDTETYIILHRQRELQSLVSPNSFVLYPRLNTQHAAVYGTSNMHPLALLPVLVAAVVRGHPAGTGTPAARFWEETLPGTPMPDVITDLVQKGIDHSPLVEHYQINLPNKDPKWTLRYGDPGSFADKAEVPPGLFFNKAQVRVGGSMNVSFPPELVPAILPRDVAGKVPFSNLTDVLSVFNMTPSSTAAAMVNDTLSRCRAPNPAGEQKTCTTSLEATLQTAVRMLGAGSRTVWAVTSKIPAGGGLPLQPYVIEAVRTLDGDRHVGCHIVPFPYAVYQCHSTGQPSAAYMVSLRGLREHGPGIAMAAICHLNTSSWNPAYPAFEILHTKPGGAPVCHFMRYANMLFGVKTGKA